MTLFQIGQVARLANVTVDTVRYYERRGLLDNPTRSNSGYRQYDEHTVSTIGFIRRAQDFGFTLSEIRRLLDIASSSSACRSDVRNEVKRKLAALDEHITTLCQTRDALQSILCSCRDEGSVSDCPILAALNAR